jgi:hypothetical protein
LSSSLVSLHFFLPPWCCFSWFQASAAILTKSELFCDIPRHRVVIVYRRFGTTYRSHIQGSRVHEESSWPLKMGPVRCPERRRRVTSLRGVISQKNADFFFCFLVFLYPFSMFSCHYSHFLPAYFAHFAISLFAPVSLAAFSVLSLFCMC